MTTQAVSGRRYFHKSVADGAKIADCPAGADRGGCGGSHRSGGPGPLVEDVAATGVEAGYQTMDVLAAIVFGYIILKSAQEKGHTEPRAQIRVVSGPAWWPARDCWWCTWG